MLVHDDTPERPRRRRTRNSDRVSYVTSGILRFVFGVLCSLTLICGGIVCLVPLLRSFLGESTVAAMPSTVDESIRIVDGPPVWRLGIGVGLLAVSLMLLHLAACSPEWTTLDRGIGIVRRQTGMFCYRRIIQDSLERFNEVSIFPISRKWRGITLPSDTVFEIVLTGPQDSRCLIGRVTLSHDLAREVAQEVAAFLSLSVH